MCVCVLVCSVVSVLCYTCDAISPSSGKLCVVSELCWCVYHLDIGRWASFCILGTVHLLTRNEIWLWWKSCLMWLSTRNVLPPIDGQWRCSVTIALYLADFYFWKRHNNFTTELVNCHSTPQLEGLAFGIDIEYVFHCFIECYIRYCSSVVKFDVERVADCILDRQDLRQYWLHMV